MRRCKHLADVNSQLQRALAAADAVFRFIDEPVETDAGHRHASSAVRGEIRFERVSFGYEQSERLALAGIDLHIRAGETVALVGSSGGGKTTMANLLPRFYPVTEGRILIDGIPIETLRLQSLRRQIAWVSQTVMLFNDTIANNVAYGDERGASEAEVRAALDAAYLTDFIASLPHGIHTIIGDNGIRLSGGQRQRLSIARALLKNAPILILDEATSALDNESERYVQAALERLMKGPDHADHRAPAVDGGEGRPDRRARRRQDRRARHPRRVAGRRRAVLAALCRRRARHLKPVADAHPTPPAAIAAASHDSSPTMPSVALILTTYNRPAALDRVLRQRCATDGRCRNRSSSPTTAPTSAPPTVVHVVARRGCGRALHHAWQPDDGFRAAASRNRAARDADTDLLLFVDGDCLLRTGVVAEHRRLAEPGCAVAGNRILLSPRLTQAVEQGLADPVAWRSAGLGQGPASSGDVERLWPLITLPGHAWRRLRPTHWLQMRGCNMAVFRKDFERINGFEERICGWGFEDSDLAIRLINAGIRVKSGPLRDGGASPVASGARARRCRAEPATRARSQEPAGDPGGPRTAPASPSTNASILRAPAGGIDCRRGLTWPRTALSRCTWFRCWRCRAHRRRWPRSPA